MEPRKRRRKNTKHSFKFLHSILIVCKYFLKIAKVLKEIDFAGLIGTIIMLFRNETIKRKIKREFILREYERTVLGDSYIPTESYLLDTYK